MSLQDAEADVIFVYFEFEDCGQGKYGLLFAPACILQVQYTAYQKSQDRNPERDRRKVVVRLKPPNID